MRSAWVVAVLLVVMGGVAQAEAPAWVAEHEAFYGVLEAEQVGYVAGTPEAFFLETARGRWLCAADACWAWPKAWPQPTRILVARDRGGQLLGVSVEALAGTLELAAAPDGALRLARSAARGGPSDALAATMPPSQRPGGERGELRGVKRGTLVRAASPPATKTVTALRAWASLAEVSSTSDGKTTLTSTAAGAALPEIDQVWTCVRPSGAPRRCGATRLVSLGARHAVGLPAGEWLVEAQDRGPNGSRVALVWITTQGDALTTAALAIGEVATTPSPCEAEVCRAATGTWITFDVRRGGCVEVRERVTWTAVHERRRNRWRDEQATAADASAAGTFRPSATGWARAACPAAAAK